MSKLFSFFAFCLLLSLGGCFGYGFKVSGQVSFQEVYRVNYYSPLLGDDFITIDFCGPLNRSVISAKDLELIKAGPCTVTSANRRLASIFQPDDTIVSVIPVTSRDVPNAR